jgi:hypothetical protein
MALTSAWKTVANVVRSEDVELQKSSTLTKTLYLFDSLIYSRHDSNSNKYSNFYGRHLELNEEILYYISVCREPSAAYHSTAARKAPCTFLPAETIIFIVRALLDRL